MRSESCQLCVSSIFFYKVHTWTVWHFVWFLRFLVSYLFIYVKTGSTIVILVFSLNVCNLVFIVILVFCNFFFKNFKKKKKKKKCFNVVWVKEYGFMDFKFYFTVSCSLTNFRFRLPCWEREIWVPYLIIGMIIWFLI